MSVRDRIEREVTAFRIDRAYEREVARQCKEKGGSDFQLTMDFFEQMQKYPSIQDRFRRLRGRLHRAKAAVLEVPYAVKHFIHRGRHGWATPDTWSFDYTLAKYMAGVLAEFRRVNIAYVDGLTFEEWDGILKEMQEGFEEYYKARDAQWQGEGDNSYVRTEQALPKLRRSLDLMNEWYPHLWW